MGREPVTPPDQREDPAGPITTTPPTLDDLKQFPPQPAGGESTAAAPAATLTATTDLICSVCCQVVPVTAPVADLLSTAGQPFRCPECSAKDTPEVKLAPAPTAVLITENLPNPQPENMVPVTPLAVQFGDRVFTIRGDHGYVLGHFTGSDGKDWVQIQLEDPSTLTPGDEYEERPLITVACDLLQLYELSDAKPAASLQSDAAVAQAADVPQRQIVSVAPAPVDAATQAIIEAMRRDAVALKDELKKRDEQIAEMQDRIDRQDRRIREQLQEVNESQDVRITLARVTAALDTISPESSDRLPPSRIADLVKRLNLAEQVRDQALKSAREFREEIKAMRAAALDISIDELPLADSTAS